MYRTGRLTARPFNKNTDQIASAGNLLPLKINGAKEALIYVPKYYTDNTPAAFAVMLHGAGGNAEHGLSLLRDYADDNNMILLAPASEHHTWDIIVEESFDRDVILLDQALSFVFERFAINPMLIAIGGFSDGASYALSIGLTNGDLFTHIIAFSPGFSFTVEHMGNPGVFISHGTKDRILPVNHCSRRIVPQLQKKGLEVNYMEFNGEHEIPPSIAKAAMKWFTKRRDE
jgi:predicted esterase